MKNKIEKKLRLHFVGIGGIGMSGIAEVFLNQGYPVTGSDQAESDSVRRLRSLGAKITLGHSAQVVEGSSCVVVSSAIQPSNPEVAEALRLRIPVIPRAEMLAELMRHRTGIAIAGSHGKTTTTSMIATLFSEAGLDPTLVIGGKVDSLGGNAKLGQGKYLIAEADESDGSFLLLPATYILVTNIDNDHLDHYGTYQKIEDAFVQFISRIPFYGRAVLCLDDIGIQNILTRVTKPYVTYGFASEALYRIDDFKNSGWGSRFSLSFENGKLSDFEIRVPGKHNVLNAVGAIVMGLELGISVDELKKGIQKFQGVQRRLQIKFESEIFLVLDDYGHHPTEIQVTLGAIRSAFPLRRINLVFQPHRYSRTLSCHDEFLKCFKNADRVWVTDIYAAGESPIEGVSAQSLVDEIQIQGLSQVAYGGSLENAETLMTKEIKEGDIFLFMGAGSITQSADRVSKKLREMSFN